MLNWKKAGFKTKENAIVHILEEIEQSPGCASNDGKVGIMYGGAFITITPKKKKKDEDI